MEYILDADKLIKELEGDIEEFGDVTLWAYWKPMDNGQDLYIEYFYPDVPEDKHTVEDFDALMKKDFDTFLRRKMKASELIQLLRDESKTI